MDEKTEELRDIFMDVSDDETVTERQEETPGSLTGAGPGADEVETVVAEMRDRYEFDTDRDDGTLATVVTEFYGGADDDAIADAIDADQATAFAARLDLHLVTDEDLEGPFDAGAARELLEQDAAPADVADALDADAERVREYARAREARDAALRANNRFRDRFEEALGDADLSRRLAAEVREDGLEDATEGMETDVSF
jgi:molybdopterin converting factor small subunit